MIPILDILTVGAKIIDRIIPDPKQRDQMKLDLAKMQQEGALKELELETQILIEQAKTNQIEAQSENLFKSGWRPATGWLCVLGLFYSFFGQPVLEWYCENAYITPPPQLDGNLLMTLLFGLLGLGTLRSVEKFKGIK